MPISNELFGSTCRLTNSGRLVGNPDLIAFRDIQTDSHGDLILAQIGSLSLYSKRLSNGVSGFFVLGDVHLRREKNAPLTKPRRRI